MSKKKLLPLKDMMSFTHILSTLLSADVGLYQSLLFCSKSLQSTKGLFFVSNLTKSLSEGKNLSQSLQDSPYRLPNIYIGMVSIGERSGALSRSLTVLQQHLLGEKRLKEKLLSAMIYPMMILIVMIFGSIFIAMFIIPSLQEATAALNLNNSNELEATLQELKNLQYGLLILLISFSLLITIHKILIKQWVNYHYLYHYILIKSWGLGTVIATINYWHFSFYMKSLLSSGIPLEQALKEASSFLPNLFLSNELTEIYQKIIKGTAPDLAFSQSAFPSEFSIWLAISAKTGNSSNSFDFLHHYYEDKFQQQVDRLTGLIDPILILLIGILLIFFILNFIAPFFNQLTDLVTIF